MYQASSNCRKQWFLGFTLKPVAMVTRRMHTRSSRGSPFLFRKAGQSKRSLLFWWCWQWEIRPGTVCAVPL